MMSRPPPSATGPQGTVVQPSVAAAATILTNFNSLTIGASSNEMLGSLPRSTHHDATIAETHDAIFGSEGETAARLQEMKSRMPPLAVCRPTMWCVPSDSSVRVKCHLPLGMVVAPMAATEAEVPVVNFGACGVIRCRQCRTYVNPFVVFIDNGRRWKCNICDTLNPVPTEYYSVVDERGIRRDVDSRPELCNGVVEIVATQEYTLRPPQTPSFVFVIDVGPAAVACGLVEAVAATIKDSLTSIPGGHRAYISFVTFDSTVHVYNFKSTLTQPQCVVIPDINDPFLPLPMNMFVNVDESRQVIEAFLDILPSMFADGKSQTSCGGSAIHIAVQLQKSMGGRLMYFTASLPSVGLGMLRNREDPRSTRPQDQKGGASNLLTSENKWYEEFALECAKQQIAVDCFFAGLTYVDIATVGTLARLTCGQNYFYHSFSPRDRSRIVSDLGRVLTRDTAFEAVLRVRASKGLQVTGFHGHLNMRGTDLLSTPNIDPDKSFGIRFAHQDSVLSTREVFIQTALLYTTATSERRIRVINLCLPVVNSVEDVYKYLDFPTIINLFAKSIVNQVTISKIELVSIREKLQQQCTDIFRQFRVHCPAQAKQPTAFLYPTALRQFPLFIFALLKNFALRPSMSEPGADLKSYLMDVMTTANEGMVTRMLLPRLYSLAAINRAGLDLSSSSKILAVLPAPLPLTVQSLNSAGVYLLDAVFVQFIWVGNAASPEWLVAVTGKPETRSETTHDGAFLPGNSELGRLVAAVVKALSSSSYLAPQVSVFLQNSPTEQNFLSMLLEDMPGGGPLSYFNFLGHLHNQVLTSKAL